MFLEHRPVSWVTTEGWQIFHLLARICLATRYRNDVSLHWFWFVFSEMVLHDSKKAPSSLAGERGFFGSLISKLTSDSLTSEAASSPYYTWIDLTRTRALKRGGRGRLGADNHERRAGGKLARRPTNSIRDTGDLYAFFAMAMSKRPQLQKGKGRIQNWKGARDSKSTMENIPAPCAKYSR